MNGGVPGAGAGDPGAAPAGPSADPPARPSGEERDAAAAIAARLAGAGHVAWFAGGCVRDRLLGIPPKDYDVATDARPEQVARIFPGARAVGEAFGVMLVRAAGHVIEVATFRRDGPYSDARRPDAVHWSDPEQDARRRDFTINGLFEDPVTGEVIDHVGGRADLEAGVIRAIGDPAARLHEDRLRTLRAVRFAARYGFALEAGTAAAIRTAAPGLAAVSRERIGLEVRAVLEHPSRARAVDLIHELGLDRPIFEGFDDVPGPAGPRVRRLGFAAAHDDPRGHVCAPGRSGEASESREAGGSGPTGGHPRPAASGRADVADVADVAGGRIDPVAVMAAWIADAAGGEPVSGEREAAAHAAGWREALVLSNRETDRLAAMLLTRAELVGPAAVRGIAARKRRIERDAFPAVLAVERAGDPALGARLAAEARRLAASGLRPVPLITGNDLRAAGGVPGPGFRVALDAIGDAQREGRVRRRAEALRLAAAILAGRSPASAPAAAERLETGVRNGPEAPKRHRTDPSIPPRVP